MEQPVIISTIVTVATPLLVGAASKWGLELDDKAVMSIMSSVLVLVASLMGKWTHARVAPTAKMARVAPDAHAAYMAALKPPVQP